MVGESSTWFFLLALKRIPVDFSLLNKNSIRTRNVSTMLHASIWNTVSAQTMFVDFMKTLRGLVWHIRSHSQTDCARAWHRDYIILFLPLSLPNTQPSLRLSVPHSSFPEGRADYIVGSWYVCHFLNMINLYYPNTCSVLCEHKSIPAMPLGDKFIKVIILYIILK